MNLIKHSLNKDLLFHSFLPSLRESVFHFTPASNWILIQRCGEIIGNTNGEFGYGSIHSQNSMGYHLGAVCLFDLRNINEEWIGEDSIFRDYFERRIHNKPCYFLVLSKNCYSSVLQLKEVNKEARDQKMYIPNIESWYVGSIDLSKIVTVHEVNLKESRD